MRTRFSFAVRSRRLRGAFRPALGALLVAAMLACPMVAYARDAQNNAATTAVGRIQGNDISVGDGIRTIGPSDQGIDVSNGNVVTVHSGKARLTLFSGGRVEICGPAKFTVLLSGNAITLALNFGRVRAELPAKTSLRVFTPTIVGTPIDIGGGQRDVTVGLNLDDSLCVLATSGAVQLEHQFSGERIIVPEAGEFFLNGGQLVPVAGKPGSCNCFADEPASRVAAPLEFAAVVPSKVAPQPQPQPTAAVSAMAVPVAALPVPPSQPNSQCNPNRSLRRASNTASCNTQIRGTRLPHRRNEELPLLRLHPPRTRPPCLRSFSLQRRPCPRPARHRTRWC